LYFIKNGGNGGIWKVPVAGGGELQVVKRPIFGGNYAVTGRGLYFTPPPDPDGTSPVQFLDFATGAITEVVKVEKPLDLGLTVSPDGRWLLFAQPDYRGSNLMLVEGFR
jgi:hypothetical protein